MRIFKHSAEKAPATRKNPSRRQTVWKLLVIAAVAAIFLAPGLPTGAPAAKADTPILEPEMPLGMVPVFLVGAVGVYVRMRRTLRS